MSSMTAHTLDNGLQVVIESIDSAASAAMRWVVPAGAGCDAADREGETTLLSELVLRGAGDLDSRTHSEALERLGVDRSTSTSAHHLSMSATMLASRVDEALPLLVDIFRRPRLPEDAVDSVRSLCMQSLAGLADDPQHRVMLKLREMHRPIPFNRSGYGTAEGLAASTIDSLRDLAARRVVPRGSILAIAGGVDADQVIGRAETLLGDWRGETPEIMEQGQPSRGRDHLDDESAQVHIGVAADAPREADPDSMLERLAIHILGGATSGRLFTEVRAKRSLCYSVGARYRAGRDRGVIALYAGTTPERAGETLEVSLGEFARLTAGVTDAEFKRAVIGLKSRLVMNGESTRARASALLSDVFRLGQPRTLDAITDRIDAITLEEINDYLARRDFGAFTIATIGPIAVAV